MTAESAMRLVNHALATRIVNRRPTTIEPSHRLEADLRLDSLAIIELIGVLEREASVFIRDEDLMAADLVTVDDLVQLVLRSSRQ